MTLDEALAFAATFPEAEEKIRWGNRSWLVRGKAYAWERPLNKADLKRLGDAPVPAGPLLAVRTDGMGEKEAVLAQGLPGVFDIEHFASFAAVLLDLSVAKAKDVRELITDGWLAMAPATLAADFTR